MFLKNKSKLKSNFLDTQINQNSNPSFENAQPSHTSSETWQHDQCGTISIFSKSNTLPNGSIIHPSEDPFPPEILPTPSTNNFNTIFANKKSKQSLKIDFLQYKALQKREANSEFTNNINSCLLNNRRILNVQNKKVEDLPSCMEQKKLMSKHNEDSLQEKQLSLLQSQSYPFDTPFSQIHFKNQQPQIKNNQEELPQSNPSFKINIHRPNQLSFQLKNQFYDNYSLEEEQEELEEDFPQIIRSSIKYPETQNQKPLRQSRYAFLLNKYENIEEMSEGFTQEEQILRDIEEQEKFVEIVERVKKLQKQCKQWAQRLIQIQHMYWIQMGEKDQMLGQIQLHLSTIDNLKYQNFIQREEIQANYIRRLQRKINRMRKYHQLISLDKESVIEELSDRISIMQFQNRITKMMETPNFNTSDLDHNESLLMGMQSKTSNHNLIETHQGTPPPQQNDLLQTQLYSELNQALEKYTAQHSKTNFLQNQLNQKNTQLLQLNNKLQTLSEQNIFVQQKNLELSSELQKVCQENLEIIQSRNMYESKWKHSVDEIAEIKRKYEDIVCMIEENEFRAERVRIDAEEQEKKMKGLLAAKDKIIKELYADKVQIQSKLNDEMNFADSLWLKLGPLFHNKLGIDDLISMQNKQKLLQSLYRIPQILLAESFYIDILYQFELTPLQISVSCHKHLMNELFIMRSHCNQLLFHLKRIQEQNREIQKELKQAKGTKERQQHLIQSLNESLMREKIVLLGEKKYKTT